MRLSFIIIFWSYVILNLFLVTLINCDYQIKLPVIRTHHVLDVSILSVLIFIIQMKSGIHSKDKTRLFLYITFFLIPHTNLLREVSSITVMITQRQSRVAKAPLEMKHWEWRGTQQAESSTVGWISYFFIIIKMFHRVSRDIRETPHNSITTLHPKQVFSFLLVIQPL